MTEQEAVRGANICADLYQTPYYVVRTRSEYTFMPQSEFRESDKEGWVIVETMEPRAPELHERKENPDRVFPGRDDFRSMRIRIERLEKEVAALREALENPLLSVDAETGDIEVVEEDRPVLEGLIDWP